MQPIHCRQPLPHRPALSRTRLQAFHHQLHSCRDTYSCSRIRLRRRPACCQSASQGDEHDNGASQDSCCTARRHTHPDRVAELASQQLAHLPECARVSIVSGTAVPCTSARACLGTPVAGLQRAAMAAAPFAAIEMKVVSAKTQKAEADAQEAAEAAHLKNEELQKVESESSPIAKLRRRFRSIKDMVYYGDTLPPIGAANLSYARFLHLLAQKQIKRVYILGDGSLALIEIPVFGWNSDRAKPPEEDPLSENGDLIIEQAPEWEMELQRFVVELPGDFWDDGWFLQTIKRNQRFIYEGYEQYESLLREGQVHPELVVLDPGNSLPWLNAYAGQLIPIVALFGLRGLIGLADWLIHKLGWVKKDPQEAMMQEMGKHRAQAFNIGEAGKDTNVRYKDVAGIDAIKNDIQEALEMLLGAQAYKDIGASPPRGIMLAGPPGTGKTYLAKAMAGEAGVPFYSANGAEFVEMFQGIASARVRDLFKVARRQSPAIIFIDEIDAIGKARGEGERDPGTQEREAGLLQLLCEMDGFAGNDQVLVIGATNRVEVLDDALMRPGRFDRTIFMGLPSASNRLKILQVHSQGKPVDRSNDDAVLRRIADLAVAYSGAELALLMNEAAILSVRQLEAGQDVQITLPILLAAMDKLELGLRERPMDSSAAKTHMAAVLAGRAVALALTPGIAPMTRISMAPRSGTVARIQFKPLEFGSQGGEYNQLLYPGPKVNAVQLTEPISSYEMCRGLLVPMYAPRATEEVLYGKKGTSLRTAIGVSRAGELADWLVRQSRLHPTFRNKAALAFDLDMGGAPDPTVQGTSSWFDSWRRQLQLDAYREALKLVRQRRPVIEAIAAQLCEEGSSETVEASHLVHLLETVPLQPDEQEAAAQAQTAAAATAARPLTAAFSSAPGRAGAVTTRPVPPDSHKAAAHEAAAQSTPQQAPAHLVTAGFSSDPGRVGTVTARPVSSVTSMQVDSAALRTAAEVVAADLDMGPLLEEQAQVDEEPELSPEEQQRREAERQRHEAVHHYATREDSPFPPPPMEKLVYAGATLNAWAKPRQDVVIV